MPFIYIHTPFSLKKKAKQEIIRSIRFRLLDMFPEWELKKEYIHFAFTKEEGLYNKDRSVMVKVEALYNEKALEKKDLIIGVIKNVVMVALPNRQIRCIMHFLSKDNTAFATTEK